MKRFYKQAQSQHDANGWTVALDGRPVRTPMRAALVLPNSALAEAIAGEWQQQGEDIDPSSMPMTGLANAAIDHIQAGPERFVDELVRFAGTDTLCYRAPPDDPLNARQAEQWDPVLQWAASELAISLTLVNGIMPARQDEDALAKVRAIVSGYDAFTLAALVSMAGLAASAILPLAVKERYCAAQTAWNLATLEESFQIEIWGEDAELAAELERKRQGFDAASQFCMHVCTAT